MRQTMLKETHSTDAAAGLSPVAEKAVATRPGRRMDAAVITAPGHVELQQVPLPQPGPGQVRIALEGCGVCASNLVPWSGPDWMTFPTGPGALGHEGWGRVEAVGDGVSGDLIGRRVATLSQNSYAAYDLADTGAIVELPPALDGKPFPGEPLGCAMNISRRSRIEPGETVAVIGIGFLGVLLTQLASKKGARVIALSRRDFSLQLARRSGAREVVQMDDHDRAIEAVRALTGGRFCDCVIETAGSQWPLDLAGELAAERGRIIIAGYHQDGPRQVNMQLWNWRGLDVINAHERAQDVYIRGIKEAVAAVCHGLIDPFPLFTHRFRLDQLGEALDTARDRPDGFVKALIIRDELAEDS